MYTAVESTQMCRVYVVLCATLQQSFSSSGKESVQVVSDKEDERIQAYVCLALPIGRVYFGHSNFKLENVNIELFLLDHNIYTHFSSCISPALSNIHSLGTGTEDPDSNKKVLFLLAAPASAL